MLTFRSVNQARDTGQDFDPIESCGTHARERPTEEKKKQQRVLLYIPVGGVPCFISARRGALLLFSSLFSAAPRRLTRTDSSIKGVRSISRVHPALDPNRKRRERKKRFPNLPGLCNFHRRHQCVSDLFLLERRASSYTHAGQSLDAFAKQYVTSYNEIKRFFSLSFPSWLGHD